MFTFYYPALIYLPVSLIVGVVFVIVPGGFIIVLGAVYFAVAQFFGLLALAAVRARRACRTRRKRPRTLVLEREAAPFRP